MTVDRQYRQIEGYAKGVLQLAWRATLTFGQTSCRV